MEDARDLILLTRCTKYVWVRLKKTHLPEVIDIMRLSVHTNETICRAVNLNENIMAAKQVDYLVEKIAKQGFSLVAIETDTHKVVGFSINILQVKLAINHEPYPP